MSNTIHVSGSHTSFQGSDVYSSSVNGDQNELRRKRVWVQLYAETKDAGLVCRRCGISRPTLRPWWERFQRKGDAGLVSLSRRPHHSPCRVLDRERIDLILVLRDERKLGPKRIQAELLRHHDLRLSTATIWKVLHAHERVPLVRRRLPGILDDSAGRCLETVFRWIR